MIDFGPLLSRPIMFLFGAAAQFGIFFTVVIAALMGFDIKDYPNAYKRFENEITLPLHTKLTDEEVDYVIEQFSRIVKEYI